MFYDNVATDREAQLTESRQVTVYSDREVHEKLMSGGLF